MPDAANDNQPSGTFAGRYPTNALWVPDDGNIFYLPRVSKEEANSGLPEDMPNTYPCLKAVALLRWLTGLIGGQAGGRILDPFCGTGSGGVAAVLEGFDYVGIEKHAQRAEIARMRIAEILKRDTGSA
jgi:site-specific DNA-methyltransferase (adenine-specific)